MTPAAGRGGARSVAPATPCTPRLPVGHTRRRCAPSPSLSKPISTPSEAPLKALSRGGGAHRLQPTASYSPRCVCHRRAVCPPARAQTSNRLAGRTGGPRLARPHPQPRNRAAQGKGQGECVDRGIVEGCLDCTPHPTPCSLLPAHLHGRMPCRAVQREPIPTPTPAPIPSLRRTLSLSLGRSLSRSLRLRRSRRAVLCMGSNVHSTTLTSPPRSPPLSSSRPPAASPAARPAARLCCASASKVSQS